MLVVTTNDIPGWEIRSRNAFAQIGAGFKSMFGGELQGMTKNLADSRNKAMGRLINEARGGPLPTIGSCLGWRGCARPGER